MFKPLTIHAPSCPNCGSPQHVHLEHNGLGLGIIKCSKCSNREMVPYASRVSRESIIKINQEKNPKRKAFLRLMAAQTGQCTDLSMAAQFAFDNL